MEAPKKGIDYTGICTCFICHDGSGRIFMAKRSQAARDEQGCWDTGGGSLDFGLTAEENVVKEIEEEYNAKPLEIAFLGYRDVFRTLPDGTNTHWLALDYLARVSPEQVRINEPHKFADSGWFELNDLPSPLHSQLTHIFGKYAAQLSVIEQDTATSS